MNSDNRNAPAAPARGIQWTPGARNLLFLLVIGGLAGGLVLLLVRIGAISGEPVTGSADLSQVLAPFIAIAIAIERFWEIVFDTVERFALTVSGLVGSARSGVKWMRDELNSAEVAVESAVAALAVVKDPGEQAAKYALLETAEGRLQAAKDRIADTVKSPEYVAVKRAITLLGSFVMGLAIAAGAQLALLNAAGIRLPLAADVLLTGLLIGAGPGPLHTFIGTLQEFRNGVANLAQLAQGAAIRNALQNVSVAQGGAGGSDRDLMPPGDTVAASPAATSQTLRSVKRVLRGRP